MVARPTSYVAKSGLGDRRDDPVLTVHEKTMYLGKLVELKRTKLLVLNKIDLIEKPRLLELTSQLAGLGDFDATFMVSALNGAGVDDLRAPVVLGCRAGVGRRRRCAEAVGELEHDPLGALVADARHPLECGEVLPRDRTP